MTFDEYQKAASATAQYASEDPNFRLMYVCMGIAGEAGEVIEKMKKIVRNDGGFVSVDKRYELNKEIGDVFWYLSELARLLDISLNDVARTNIKKLSDRAVRNVIRSEGDNR